MSILTISSCLLFILLALCLVYFLYLVHLVTLSPSLYHTHNYGCGKLYTTLNSKKSTAEVGTLYQLRNLLGRSSVVKKPLDDFNACDDFFVLVVKCHVIAAAMKMLNMSQTSQVPFSPLFPPLENKWIEQRGNVGQDFNGDCEPVCRLPIPCFR